MLPDNCYNKLEELCRLCLVKENSLHPIFDPLQDASDALLVDKITICLPVNIRQEDIFSKQICENCLCKIEEYYEFRSKTIHSQNLLEKLADSIRRGNTPEVTCLQNSSNFNSEQSSDLFVTELKEEYDDNGLIGSVFEEPEEEERSVTEGNTNVYPEEIIISHSSKNNLESSTHSEEQDPLDGRRGIETIMSSQEKDEVGGLTCIDCGQEFKTKRTLIEHVKKLHSNYKCDECDAKFTCSRYLARHEARHTAKATIPCLLCNKLFINNSELKEHKKSHKIGEPITCTLCDYQTLYKSNLSRHLKRHNKDYILFCDTCGDGCYNKDELYTHQIKKHGAIPYYCAICTKTFTSRGCLNEHNKTSHWITTEKFLCKTCGKAFKTRTATKRHMKTHLGLKFLCHICNKSVSSAYSLKKHLQAHSGEKNVVCYICGKTFVDNKYMAAHLRSHTGERPYVCSECGKRFTQATTLKVHMRYHTGQRPYVCHICGSGFVTNTLLSNHIKGHNKSSNNLQQI